MLGSSSIKRAPSNLVMNMTSSSGYGAVPAFIAFSRAPAASINRFKGARLMELDPSIHHGTLEPQKLLKNDGTVVTQIVESVRRPARGYDRRNASFDGGARLMTVRSFLSANAIRAKDSLDEVDWCSSNNSTPCAVWSISIPILITAMGAHYFI